MPKITITLTEKQARGIVERLSNVGAGKQSVQNGYNIILAQILKIDDRRNGTNHLDKMPRRFWSFLRD